MKRIPSVLFFIISAVFLCTQTFRVQASDLAIQSNYPKPTIEYALPYPGILPDHTLYFIKVWRDQMLLFFTRDSIKKTLLYLLIADKKMSMGKQLWEKGNSQLAGVSFVEAQKHMIDAVGTIKEYKKTHIPPPGLADKLELALKKHDELFNSLLSTLPSNISGQSLNEALEINHQAIQQIQTVK